MGRRRKARECALQLLFEMEFNESVGLKDLTQEYWKNRKAEAEVKEYAGWLCGKISENRAEIDGLITPAAKKWRLDRMAAVDRNILRIAVCEMLYEPALGPAIIINEAVEVAKRYGGEDSAVFVNGVLDAVGKTIKSGTEKKECEPEEGRNERE